jgi:hypothetical protein
MSHIEMLRMALIGYEAEQHKIDQKIAEIRNKLGGGGPRQVPSAPVTTEGAKHRRKISASARARIAAAQRKRWAAFHKQQGAGAMPVEKKVLAKKRTMSAAGRRAIAEATKKRWAAYRAKQSAAARKKAA